MTVTALVDGDGAGRRTTASAADGSWAFTGLDVGAGRPYALKFRDPSGACLPLDYDAEPSTTGTIDMVRVVAGQTTTARAVMRRAAVLTGTLRNSLGVPLAGVAVTARLEGAEGQLTAATDADGSWRFAGLDVTADRRYAVSFSDPGGSHLPMIHDADPLTPGPEMVTLSAGQTARADAVLRRSCTLSGVVTDSRTGRPVAGVPVEPVPAPGSPPPPPPPGRRDRRLRRSP